MSKAEAVLKLSDRLTSNAVLQVVGGGRGFVVQTVDSEGPNLVITAAHCLPHLPPAHPYPVDLLERTYQRLLGPLGAEPTVWAECLFADPIIDIAVLRNPGNQELHREADAYQKLTASMQPLAIVGAPVQGRETPGHGSALLLSLDGQWLEVRVEHRHEWLSIEPEKAVVPGMSGSPIIWPEGGGAIGVVSTAEYSPVLTESLPPRIIGLLKSRPSRRKS
jgi:hypothetical protein